MGVPHPYAPHEDAMTSPQPDAPVSVPAHEQLPLGARWRGSRRYATGWLLVFSGVFTIFLVPPVGVVLLAVGAWLAWQGRRLRTQRIPVWPRSVPEERRGDPPGGAVVLDISPHLRRGDWPHVKDGRLSLYVMDKHRTAIRRIVSLYGALAPDGRDGVLAAWGEVAPEPKNKYDPRAVQVRVQGSAVAYLSLEWKELAHRRLREVKPHSLVVPVVVRQRGKEERAWAFGSMGDAQSFAAWVARKDHGLPSKGEPPAPATTLTRTESPKGQEPVSSTVMDISAQLSEKGWTFTNGNRVSLYVMDKHRAAIHKLVRQHSQFVRRGNGGDGAFAAWGEVVAEPGNRYDSEAVRVLVHGQPVAYFSLDWKELAHDWLHVAGWRSLVVPVVVRWWDQDEFVWAFGSMADAESFAAWATRKDHG